MKPEEFDAYIKKEDGVLPFLKEVNKKKEMLLNENLSQEEKNKMLEDLSNKIAEKMTSFAIFIQKDYFKEFVKGSATTIDPFDNKVLIEISGKNTTDYIEVRCDFWGPCCPRRYFASPLRIIVIDFEAYSEYGEYEEYQNGSRTFLGGHLQAIEFSDYNELAQAHKTSVDICNRMRKKKDTPSDKTETMRDCLCILEHNFFPALALTGIKRSDKPSRLYRWANLFTEILSELLKFYEGDIILGEYGYLSTLATGDDSAKQHLFNYLKTKSYEQLKSNNGYPTARMLGATIEDSDNEEIFYTTQRGETKSKRVSMIRDGARRNWYACPHPSNPVWKNEEFKQNFVKWIVQKLKVKGTI